MVLMEALEALQAHPEDGKDLALMALLRRAPVTTLVAGVVLTLVVLLLRPVLPMALVAGKDVVLMIVLPRQAPVTTLVAGKALAPVALLLQVRPEDGRALIPVVLLHLALVKVLVAGVVLTLGVLPHPALVKVLVAGVVLILVVLLRPVLVKALVAGEVPVPTAGIMADR
ncbi:uncharacterized protein N7503_002317 [Penicillium pulvis]|uniref:uncharacterized protein n=1 Tax=Penicillium pulvis TaxID=1562058 RepID=UPI002548EE73|nr:uncharacterized protein N7503_002317 [Penicillium pulvis]KAJ5810099.1 hypothetical protein N7503_002317 [Penicillium pulvis]